MPRVAGVHVSRCGGRADVARYRVAQSRAILEHMSMEADDRPNGAGWLDRRAFRVATLVALTTGAVVAAATVVVTGAAAGLPVAVLALGLIGLVATSASTWWPATLLTGAASGVAIATSGQPSAVAYGVWVGVALAAAAASYWACRSRERARALVDYLQARARHHTIHDELTGLLNLRGAELVGGGLLELARRDGDALCAAIICVEDDGLAMTTQERADALLTVTEAASGVFRGSDVLARLSADCLLVVAKGSGLGMDLVASRMIDALADLDDGAGPAPTVAVGAALLPPWEEGSLADLIEFARRDLVMQWSLRQQQVARQQPVIEVDPTRQRAAASSQSDLPDSPPPADRGEESPGDVRF